MMPFATTTVTIDRPDDATDRYETATLTTIATVRGNVTRPTGSDRHIGGQQEIVDAVLFVDQGTDIAYGDQVTDGDSIYTVVWATARAGFGLDHIKAGLRRVTGAANG